MNEEFRPARPYQRLTADGRRVREVLTYSRRGSRFSEREQDAWDRLAEAWVVPDEAVDEPGFGWGEWFSRPGPLVVEVGSGVGETVAALAAGRPDANVLAFEVWRPGIAGALWRLEQAGVDNVRLVGVDAVWSMRHLFASGSIAELWTFFPDPWPKARHHKRRLVQPAYAHDAATAMAPGATWRLATDWQEYAEQMVAVLHAEPLLTGGVSKRWAERPVTRFEGRGEEAGRSITDLAYVRRGSGS